MQYLLYCVVFFRVQSTTKEVFVAHDVDTTLTYHEVFTQWYAHDVEVASTQYKKANGIPYPFGNDTNSP
jgi:hypothetical protein